MPSVAHFLYIPMVIMVGIVIGFILGGRAARDAQVTRERAEAEKAARRAARLAKQGGGDGAPPSPQGT